MFHLLLLILLMLNLIHRLPERLRLRCTHPSEKPLGESRGK
jgi:hypothetical protein